MPRPPSEAMTIQEVADFLQLSTRTVRRLAYNGHLPFSKIGRTLRFSRRRLIEIIEKGINTNVKPGVKRKQKV